MAMEHLAKTISKNGGIAAVTIQEGADRLRELEARAECERLKELLRIESASAQHALAWAERAETALAEVEGQTSTTLLNMQQRNAALHAELAKIYSLVAPHGCDLAPNGIWETARAVSDLLASLRAEVEALKQSIESGQRVLREDAERNAARAERAEAEVERLTMDNRILTTRANSGDAQFTAVHARAERAEAECLEQARLLGMSASREASLLGKISRLEHQLEK